MIASHDLEVSTPALLLSGTAGAGKSIVAKEIHELLRRAQVRNAMIDLDAVGRVAPVADPPYNSKFVIANLRSMWPNFEALDLEYVILARVLLSADELDAYRVAFPFLDLRVVRLEAPDGELVARLAAREPGVSRSFLMELAPALANEMRANDLDEFVVENGPDRSVGDVALEILELLGWPRPDLT